MKPGSCGANHLIMRNPIFAICILACASLFAAGTAYTSRKPELQSEYLKLRPSYTAAIKAQDSVQFLQATEDLKQFSIKIIQANMIFGNGLITYRSAKNERDGKYGTATFHDSTDDVYSDMVTLNRKLWDFTPPTEMTPATIRDVDNFITLISRSIDNHDITCLKAQMKSSSFKGGSGGKTSVTRGSTTMSTH